MLIEVLLVLQEFELPGWLLPYSTPYDIVATMHHLFPAFMNGCRCVTGALYVNHKAIREAALDRLCDGTRDLTMRVTGIARTLVLHSEEVLCDADDDGDEQGEEGEKGEDGNEEGDSGALAAAVADDSACVTPRHSRIRSPPGSAKRRNRLSGAFGDSGILLAGLAGTAQRAALQREVRDGTVERTVKEQLEKIGNPAALKSPVAAAEGVAPGQNGWITLRNLVVYLIARYLFIKGAK